MVTTYLTQRMHHVGLYAVGLSDKRILLKYGIKKTDAGVDSARSARVGNIRLRNQVEYIFQVGPRKCGEVDSADIFWTKRRATGISRLDMPKPQAAFSRLASHVRGHDSPAHH